MSKTPWIVAVQGKMDIKCLRCGSVFIVSNPVMVTAYVAAAKVFIKAHKTCKVKAKP